jgi:magnesium chelatase family protein
MALSRALSGTCYALDAVAVDIEVDLIKTDKPFLVIVGLPDTSVREAKDRVLTAIKNSSIDISEIGCTVNLAPADLKKEGSSFDLPIAIGLMRALNILQDDRYKNYLIVGELGLGGDARPVSGALALAYLAKTLGLQGIILPKANSLEASLVPDIEVLGVTNLKEVVHFLQNKGAPIKSASIDTDKKELQPVVDFAEVHGQQFAKRALEVAAAGGHNILMSGPPGSGKSMLAKALCGILPKMSFEESLEVTKIHSIAGIFTGDELLQQRPFRSPHHTTSYAGLIGGGTIPRPGEIVLSHRGVLFLDELPEFSRHVLEALRQPLEERSITISRAASSITFPCSCLFVAAMNPCPCGYLGHPDKPCRDTKLQIDRYMRKISGPLLDRIDLCLTVQPVKTNEIHLGKASEPSHVIKKRVEQARERQKARFKSVKTNAEMSSKDLTTYFPLDSSCKKLFEHAIDSFHLSMRSAFRALKVAATIADLANCDSIQEEHLLEALSFKQTFDHT